MVNTSSTISWGIEAYEKIMAIQGQHRSKYLRDLVNQKTLPSVNVVITALDLGEFTLEELKAYSIRLLAISNREKG